jgi:hypothetical protein
MRRSSFLAVTLVVIAGCGGSTKQAETSAGSVTTAPAATTSSSAAVTTAASTAGPTTTANVAVPTTVSKALPTTVKAGAATTAKAGSKKMEFVETTSTFRLVNVAVIDGKNLSIDVYMGRPKFGGEKVATVAPGAVSDVIKVKLVKADGSTAAPKPQIVLHPAGDVDPAHQIHLEDKPFVDGEKRIWIAGSTKPSSTPGANYGIGMKWIYLEGVPKSLQPAPDGKAIVGVQNVALAHLEKDFLVVGTAGGCFDLLPAGTSKGNLGPEYAVAPGTVDLALFDANTECKSAAGKAVPTVVAAGDRFLLIANGLTEADRSVMVLKV